MFGYLREKLNVNHFWKLKVKDAYFTLINVNPLSPSSDLDRISPYTISMIPSRHVMRIKKISIRGLLVDPIPNSPN